MTTPMFRRPDIGHVGTDATGIRFVVLSPGVVKGTESCDDPWYVALLPRPLPEHGEYATFAAGQVTHASYLTEPFLWETKQ